MYFKGPIRTIKWPLPFFTSGRLDRLGLNVYILIGPTTFHVRLQRGRRPKLEACNSLLGGEVE